MRDTLRPSFQCCFERAEVCLVANVRWRADGTAIAEDGRVDSDSEIARTDDATIVCAGSDYCA